MSTKLTKNMAPRKPEPFGSEDADEPQHGNEACVEIGKKECDQSNGHDEEVEDIPRVFEVVLKPRSKCQHLHHDFHREDDEDHKVEEVQRDEASNGEFTATPDHSPSGVRSWRPR